MRARASNDRESRSAESGSGARETDHRVFFFHIAADQLVRLRDLNDFLHARHFFKRALFDFALVAGNANGGAGCARHGMRAIAELFDFLADGADLVFAGLRLHDYKHGIHLRLPSLSFPKGCSKSRSNR